MAIGSPALLTVDWPNRIIFISKGYMSVVQTTPTEIRALNTIVLHQDLRDLEDDEEGIVYPTTHNFVGPITVGGVALAQVIEIINDYTITFEENPPAGSPPCPVPYAVNLQGSNNNIADRTNVNSVSVRSANSAGLTYSKEVEDLAFEDARIWVNTIRGQAGTQYPLGTVARPVNNVADALAIRSSRNLPYRVHFVGEVTVPTSITTQALNVLGESENTSLIHLGLPAGSPLPLGSPALSRVDVTGNVFEKCTVDGFVTGEATYNRCKIDGLNGFDGEMYDCGIDGTVTLGEGVGDEHRIIDCHSAVAGTGAPTLDLNFQQNLDFSVRGYNGGILLKNLNDPNSSVTVDLNSGHCKLDPTLTAGTIVVRGTGHITDNSSEGCTVVRVGLVEARAIDRTIYVNTTAIQNGNGFLQTPFDNITDALAATDTQFVFTLYIDGDVTITNEDVSGLSFTGPTVIGSTLTMGANVTSDNRTQFLSTDVQGTFNGPAIFDKCLIRNITCSEIFADGCLVAGRITVAASGSPLTINDSQIHNSRDAGLGSIPIFDFNGTQHTLNMKNYSGDLTLENMTAGDTANISIVGGIITIDATCTGGTVRVDGTGQLVNNAGTAVTINEDNLIYQAGGISRGGM